jgi:hypothetical protein
MSAPTHRLVNGVVVPLTPEEIAALEADWAQYVPPPQMQPQDLTDVLLAEINEMRAALNLPPRAKLEK